MSCSSIRNPVECKGQLSTDGSSVAFRQMEGPLCSFSIGAYYTKRVYVFCALIQNIELRNLLRTYLESDINYHLKVPPTQTIDFANLLQNLS